MKEIWITGGVILLCIGSLVFGGNHYAAKVEETRSNAYKQFIEEETKISHEEEQMKKERQSINKSQLKQLKDAHAKINKVYDDSKHQSNELKEILQDLTSLIDQQENKAN